MPNSKGGTRMEETKLVRNLRKERQGLVVSTKMDKTIVVAVQRRVKHPSMVSSCIGQQNSMRTTRRMSAE